MLVLSQVLYSNITLINQSLYLNFTLEISWVMDFSPVPCVISFKFLGGLQNYKFLESLGPTEPEK